MLQRLVFGLLQNLQSPHWGIYRGITWSPKNSEASLHVLLHFIIWLAPWAGKMNQIVRCDWLPERARWSYFARSGFLAWSRKIKHHFLVFWPSMFSQDGWILVLFFFFTFMDQDGKHAKKKELGQYPAILTSCLVNNPYKLYSCDSLK